MVLPTSVISACRGKPILIEIKDGTTYNGLLVSCDSYMNVTLKEVVCTSASGDRFWKIDDCYVRGQTIKYFRVPDEALELATEEDHAGGAARGRGSGPGAGFRGRPRGAPPMRGGPGGGFHRGGMRGMRGGAPRGGMGPGRGGPHRGGRGGMPRGGGGGGGGPPPAAGGGS